MAPQPALLKGLSNPLNFCCSKCSRLVSVMVSQDSSSAESLPALALTTEQTLLLEVFLGLRVSCLRYALQHSSFSHQC